jgi:hypothetical protein
MAGIPTASTPALCDTPGRQGPLCLPSAREYVIDGGQSLHREPVCRMSQPHKRTCG